MSRRIVGALALLFVVVAFLFDNTEFSTRMGIPAYRDAWMRNAAVLVTLVWFAVSIIAKVMMVLGHTAGRTSIATLVILAFWIALAITGLSYSDSLEIDAIRGWNFGMLIVLLGTDLWNTFSFLEQQNTRFNPQKSK